MDSRYLQTLLPSTDKVSYIELHPTLPWLACFDRADYVTVWDWQKHEVVMECQLGSNTQLNRQEVELHSRSEADVNFFGRPLADYVAQNYTIGHATGKLRSVEFVDLDTFYWKTSMQTLISHGPAARAPSVNHLGMLADRRYLMIVAERAIILMDLLSKRVKTIPATHPNLGGETFYNAVFLLRDVRGGILLSPQVAIACSDNNIWVVDAFRVSVLHVLTNGPNSPVSSMLVIPCPQGGDWLFVGDERGGVHTWRPSSGLPQKESDPPIGSLSHKDAVLSLLYIPWVDDTGTPAPRLGVVTADNRVAIYNVSPLQPIYKVKLLDKTKMKVTGACVACGAVATEHKAKSIIVSTNTPMVLAFSPEDCKTPAVVINLESAIPARTDKKDAKLYYIANHPLWPDIVAAATNAGVAILRSHSKRGFPICGLSKVVSFKAADPAPDDDLLIAPSSPTIGTDDNEESRARAVSFVVYGNGKLEGVTFTAQSDENDALRRAVAEANVRDRAGVNDPPASVLQASRCTIHDVGEGEGPSDVKANAAGNLVAVCWHSISHQTSQKGPSLAAQGLSRYKVFRCMPDEGDPATHWQPWDEGLGSHIEWHHTNDWLAVMVTPPPLPATPMPQKSKNAKEAAIESAMREAAAARLAAASAYVVVREMDPSVPNAAQELCKVSGTSESAVSAIHGGALLGVVRSTPGATGSAGPGSNRTLHLLDWTSGQETGTCLLTDAQVRCSHEVGRLVGIELPEPIFASYAQTGEYAALAYPEGIDIYTIDTNFTHLTRIGVRNATSAVWNGLQLFTTTETALFITFVVPHAQQGSELAERTNLFAQTGGDGLPELSSIPSASTTKLTTIELATLSVGSSRDFKRFPGTRTELPLLSIRPGNNARLLRATDTAVWMATCHGHPYAISLKHTGIRCRQRASAGDLKGARRLAQQSLDARYHDALALFFSAFGQDGVSEALLLPGLSLELELALSIKCGALKRGWACLASLLAGCKDSTLLCRFSAWNHRDIDPSKVDEPDAESEPPDPFSTAGVIANSELGNKGLNNNEIEKVVAVFTQAAGITAPHVLARLIPTGIQGRKTALDEDFFSSAPEGDDPKHVAKVKAPPPTTKYTPMFPRAKIDENQEYEIEMITDADNGQDVIDWDLPLRKPAPEQAAPEEDAKSESKEQNEANGETEENGDAPPQKTTAIGANEAPEARVLELGIQLLDASVRYADVNMLQQTIQLMAPHTGIMTPAQQQRMVAAVGACGLASHLSDLTLSGTTPLMPLTAMLAGFLSGDAQVASRVLEKEGLLPLKALFMQSCGAGGLEATVEWEQHLQGILGGPTRQLTITPTTS